MIFAEESSWICKVAAYVHSIYGVWPEDKDFRNVRRFSRFRGNFIIFVIIGMLLFQFTALKNTTSAQVIIESVTEMTMGMVGMLKLWGHFFNRKKILKLLHQTKRLCSSFSAKSEEQSEIYVRWKTRHDRLMKFCFLSYLSIFIVFDSTLFADGKFPFVGHMPEISYTYPWFQIIYSIETGMHVFTTLAFFSYDAFCMSLICQLRCELELVEQSMLNLSRGDKPALRRTIRRHACVLDYGGNVCDCLQLTFVLQHIITSIFFCFTGITILKLETSVSFSRIIAIALVLCITMLLVCFVGEGITSASSAIAQAIESHCIEAFLDDPVTLKNVTFMLGRAQKPLRMTIGVKNSINLVLFADTMNVIMSSFMVLKAIIE